VFEHCAEKRAAPPRRRAGGGAVAAGSASAPKCINTLNEDDECVPRAFSSPPPPMSDVPLIAAVAILGRGGAPQYFKSFGGDEAARLQFAVFAALDVIGARVPETRALAPGGGGGAPAAAAAAGAAAGGGGGGDRFLGLLFPVEEHKVFGFVSNGNVKFVIVIRDVLLLEDRVRELFRALHRRYLDAVCNPFTSHDARITSPGFEEAVYRLVENANETIEYKGPLPF
jgi:hypothetical protein